MKKTSIASLLLCVLILSISHSGVKIQERHAVHLQPSGIFLQEPQIPSNEYARAISGTTTHTPSEGIVIGTSDYDYAINSGFTRRIVTSNNGTKVHMVFLERNVLLSSPSNRAACKYLYYDYNFPSNLVTAYPRPKSLGATGFAGLDVFQTGAGAGTAVMTYTSGGKTYFAIDGGPGLGTFTETPLPDAISNRVISDPQVTISHDGAVIWFTAVLGNKDCIIARSTDFGMTWGNIDTLKKYIPLSGLSFNPTSAPLLIAPNGTMYRLATLHGKGSLPPLGSAHPDSADRIGYFKSTNNGTNWSWSTIGRDGDMLVDADGDTSYTLFENFSQFSGVVDSGSVLHVVSNGYSLKVINDSTTSNRFYTLYYKDGSAVWKIISNRREGKYSDYDSSYYKYSGNGIGFPYPTISAERNILFVQWSQPLFKAGRLDTTGGRIQYELYRNFGSNTYWEYPYSIANSVGALFVSSAQNPVWSGENYYGVATLYLADTSRGNSIFEGLPPVQVPWIYRQINMGIISSVDKNVNPFTYSLSQNYPNPFNPSTVINFQMPVKSHVSLKVYDAIGREAATVVNEERGEGNHSVTFDASKLSSGLYFYTIRAGNFVETKKMMVLR